MLELRLITNDNLDYAVRVENEIFPEYDAKNNYIKSIDNSSQSQFFLVYDKEKCVGVTGIYSYKNDRDSAWLGFFGIKKEYRDKGYGRKVLKLTEEFAKNLGFRYMRLFTDKENNDQAINFYINNGYAFEDYNNEQEALKDEFNVVIGSKSLDKRDILPLWNNRFINLTKQTYKQQYSEEVIEMTNDTITESVEDENIYYEEEDISHKDKKRIKLVNKLLSDNDIKYRGILSYRYLRIIAWLSLAIAQYCIVLNIGLSYTGQDMIYPSWWFTTLQTIGYFSVPFFLLASFSLILSRNKTYKSMVMFYGIAYIGVALALIFVFDRYVGKVIYAISESHEAAKSVVLTLFNMKADFNVFGDLFVLSLFNFFLNYELKKGTSKKKVIGFRLLAILPLAFALGSYIITVLVRQDLLSIPFELCPFLTTKSPLIYLVFICMSIWIKNRERIFVGFGASSKEYNKFLRTNKNSLSFSIHVSVLFLLVSIIDFILLIVVPNPQSYEIGQAVGLFIAIPFVLLFSYNKMHKDKTIDLILPFVGIVIVILAYAEALYHVIMALF